MLTYLWVAVGGALGSVGRFWLNGIISARFGEAFPWGTMMVNLSGSFLIGFFAALTGPEGRFFVSAPARAFFMVGVCGGYTTFSSFSLQTLHLATDGEWLYAGTNVLFSVVLCLAGVWLGFLLANQFNQMR